MHFIARVLLGLTAGGGVSVGIMSMNTPRFAKATPELAGTAVLIGLAAGIWVAVFVAVDSFLGRFVSWSLFFAGLLLFLSVVLVPDSTDVAMASILVAVVLGLTAARAVGSSSDAGSSTRVAKPPPPKHPLD